MTELEEAKERADAAVELALQAQQRLKIREEVLTLQIVVQESLKKSIEDSRERALREVERLKSELAIRDEKVSHLEEKMERALASVAHFTHRYNEDLAKIRDLDRTLGWVKTERDSEKKHAEGLFNTNCTLKQLVAELESKLDAAMERPTNGIGWRVGKTVPLNVYEGDQPVCQCHNTEDARRIVEAMNNAALNADEYGRE